MFVNLLFTEEKSVQKFFWEIRSQQRGVIIFLFPSPPSTVKSNRGKINRPPCILQECGAESEVDKLFQYRLYDSGNNEERLEKLANFAVYYSKWMSVDRGRRVRTSNVGFTGPRTLNFTKRGTSCSFQYAYLVLLSKTFNISEKVEEHKNISVLCSLNIVTYRFILVFHNAREAHHFYRTFQNHLDHRIHCPVDWLLPEILEKLQYLWEFSSSVLTNRNRFVWFWRNTSPVIDHCRW